tara:strand:+ start:21185 stop:21406 length:222 start_codon:yes stop_codon:yes gene_type:complete
MTESSIEILGFDLVKRYNHDQFSTDRFQKGIIQVEFTYETDTDKLLTADIVIDEVVGKEVSIEDLKHLDRILN